MTSNRHLHASTVDLSKILYISEVLIIICLSRSNWGVESRNRIIWIKLNSLTLLLLLLSLLHNVYIFSVCYLTKHVTAAADKIKINEVFSCSVDIIISTKQYDSIRSTPNCIEIIVLPHTYMEIYAYGKILYHFLGIRIRFSILCNNIF